MTRSRAFRPALTAACVIACMPPAHALGQTTSTYIGPDGGVWSSPLNWTTGVPHGDFHAVIDGNAGAASEVQLDMFAQLHHLTVDFGDTLRVTNGEEVRMHAYDGTSVIANSWVIRLDSTGSHTYLRLDPLNDGDVFTLQGNGQVILSNTGPNWIYEINGDAVLHNVSNHIFGAGNIGWNNLEVINDFVISANMPGSTLVLDAPPLPQKWINNGSLVASGAGAVLEIRGGLYDNVNGQIQADTDGVVKYMSGATIRGGNLVTQFVAPPWGGEHQVADDTVFFDVSSGPLRTDGLVRILNNAELRTLGTGEVQNYGRIELGSTGSNTWFRFQGQAGGDTVMLTGGGEIVASDGPNWMYEMVDDVVLHNVDNTIRGGTLNIGWNNMELVNDGLVWCDSGDSITIDPPSDVPFGVVNRGTLRADGGTLHLLGGEYDNGTGVIEALNGSIVELVSGAAINGGILRGASGGEIRAAGTASFLDVSGAWVPTLQGTVRIPNGRELRPRGHGILFNSGELLIDSTGSNTWFRLQPHADGDTVTLAGGGQVVASAAGPNWIYDIDGDAVLHNLDNTIRGGNLHIGWDTMQFINDALVVGDSGAAIEIDPPGDGPLGVLNRGTLRADGGTLRLLDGDFDNQVGVIEALHGSFVELAGAAIRGGTLRGVMGGEIRATGTPSFLDLAITPTLEGMIHVIDDGELRTRGAGSVQNTGTILLDSQGSDTYLRLQAQEDGDVVTLDGGGQIIASDGDANWIYELGGNAVLHNLNNTIRGGHLNIGWNNLEFINDGILIAESDVAPLDVDPQNGGIGFDHRGTILVTGLAGMQIGDGPFTTSGVVTVETDRTLTRAGTYTQTGGESTIDGELVITADGIVALEGGTLAGGGTVHGAVENSGGSVEPGASAGVLSVDGDYAQSLTGQLVIELGGTTPGTGHDQLAVTGTASLDGTLVVNLIDGFTPSEDDHFVILTAGQVNGTFAFTDLPDLGEMTLEVQHNADNVTLGFASCPSGCADTDANCVVDVDDLIEVILGWGCTDPPQPCSGDVNDDGTVDVDDLVAVILQWGPCGAK